MIKSASLASIASRRKCLKQNIWGKSFLSSSTDRKRYLPAFLNLRPEFPISVEYASLQSFIISGRSDSFGFLKMGKDTFLFMNGYETIDGKDLLHCAQNVPLVVIKNS